MHGYDKQITIIGSILIIRYTLLYHQYEKSVYRYNTFFKQTASLTTLFQNEYVDHWYKLIALMPNQIFAPSKISEKGSFV